MTEEGDVLNNKDRDITGADNNRHLIFLLNLLLISSSEQLARSAGDIRVKVKAEEERPSSQERQSQRGRE